MAAEKELLEQKRFLEKRKLVLEKYQSEIRILQGKICHHTYYRNSGIETGIEQDKTIRHFKKELKAWTIALKRDYGITNRLIPHLLSKYKSEIFRIDRQIDTLENQAQVHYPEPRGEEAPQKPAEDRSGFARKLSGVAKQSLAQQPEHCREDNRDR